MKTKNLFRRRFNSDRLHQNGPDDLGLAKSLYSDKLAIWLRELIGIILNGK